MNTLNIKTNGNLKIVYRDKHDAEHEVSVDLIDLILTREEAEAAFPSCRQKNDAGQEVFRGSRDFFATFAYTLEERYGFKEITTTTAQQVWEHSYTLAVEVKKNTSVTRN